MYDIDVPTTRSLEVPYIDDSQWDMEELDNIAIPDVTEIKTDIATIKADLQTLDRDIQKLESGNPLAG